MKSGQNKMNDHKYAEDKLEGMQGWGELDTDIIRRYICAGYIPTPGLVLSLCDEIDILRAELGLDNPSEQVVLNFTPKNEQGKWYE